MLPVGLFAQAQQYVLKACIYEGFAYLPFRRNTVPGGWVEFIDLDLTWQSSDGSLTEEHSSLKFNKQFLKASRDREMEPSPGPLLQGYLESAGFSDIRHEKFFWPVGTWPADKHLVKPSLIPLLIRCTCCFRSTQRQQFCSSLWPSLTGCDFAYVEGSRCMELPPNHGRPRSIHLRALYTPTRILT